jgi:deazaflavin-dependent oxidoreductase (nitroreductase family)
LATKSSLVLTHYGRKTGKPYEVALWFVVKDATIYLETVNVERQWVRNVSKNPQVEALIGGQKFNGKVTRLTEPEERKRAEELRARKYLVFRILRRFERLLSRGGAFRVDLNS